MAPKTPKPVSAEDRDGVKITATLVTGDNPGLVVFIPGDFSKPTDLPKTSSGKMHMLVSTENWLAFKGFHPKWDLVGGLHFGYSTPRAKRG